MFQKHAGRFHRHAQVFALTALMLAAFFFAASPGAAANTLGFATKWGSLGASTGQFDDPSGIALGANGNVYVADFNNHRIQVFTSSGAFVTGWGSFGTGNGQFARPRDVACDAAGNVYVADFDNNRVQKFTSTGTYITQWGGEGIGDGQFKGPRGIAIDAGGFVYVCEDGLPTKRVQKFTNAGAYVTQWGSFGTSNGQFTSPRGIAVDGSGFVYVSDTQSDRVQKFTNTGVFVSAWGTTGTGNGQFSFPIGLACRGALVYVVDSDNGRVQIFTSTGSFLSQVGSVCNLANGTGCVDPDAGGPLAVGDGQFFSPRGVTVDPNGNAFVVDAGNNRIEKFDRTPTSDAPGGGSFIESFLVSPNPAAFPIRVWLALASPATGGRERYRVDAGVYDIAGRLVQELYDGEMPAGEHVLTWDGATRSGASAASGIFFLRLGVDGEQRRSVKIVRLDG